MKKLHISFAAILAILLGLMTVAYAATELYQHITFNWNGDIIQEAALPFATPTPPPPGTEDQQVQFEIADEIMRTIPEDEYGVIIAGNSMYARQRTKTFSTMDAFLQALSRVDYLTVPRNIPDNFHFERASIYLECDGDGEYVLAESSVINGCTLMRYTVAENDNRIVGYDLLFRESQEDYHYLSIYSKLNEYSDENDFSHSVPADCQVYTVEIPGMSNVVAISGENRGALRLRRMLETPLVCQTLPEPLYNGILPETFTYAEELIDVSAPLLEPEVLMQLFIP